MINFNDPSESFVHFNSLLNVSGYAEGYRPRCFLCGGTTPDEHWTGCPFAPDDPNEVECGKCESWHRPELPCVSLSSEAEDRLALRV